MSDTKMNSNFNNTTITFTDEPENVSDQTSDAILKPINEDTSDSYPNLPSASSFYTFLSVFNNSNPNGIWKLYIVDDTGSDGGRVSGGWSLTFLVDPSVGDTSPAP